MSRYNQTAKLPSCCLSRSDLLGLYGLIDAEFPDRLRGTDVSISGTFDGVSIEHKDSESFLNEEERLEAIDSIGVRFYGKI